MQDNRKSNNMIKYIYTQENCPNCEKLKQECHEKGIQYKERSSERFNLPNDEQDRIDTEAYIELCMNNMKFPVVVDIEQ